MVTLVSDITNSCLLLLCYGRVHQKSSFNIFIWKTNKINWW